MTEPTPTPAETIAVAQSGQTGMVKTVTDIRIEQLEAKLTARFEQLEKENAELRKANAELYAYANSLSAAAQQSQPAQQPAAAAPVQASAGPVAAAAVPDPNAEQLKAQQAKDEQAMLDLALAKLGYKREPDNSGM